MWYNFRLHIISHYITEHVVGYYGDESVITSEFSKPSFFQHWKEIDVSEKFKAVSQGQILAIFTRFHI